MGLIDVSPISLHVSVEDCETISVSPFLSVCVSVCMLCDMLGKAKWCNTWNKIQRRRVYHGRKKETSHKKIPHYEDKPNKLPLMITAKPTISYLKAKAYIRQAHDGESVCVLSMKINWKDCILCGISCLYSTGYLHKLPLIRCLSLYVCVCICLFGANRWKWNKHRAQEMHVFHSERNYRPEWQNNFFFWNFPKENKKKEEEKSCIVVNCLHLISYFFKSFYSSLFPVYFSVQLNSIETI